MLLFQHVNGYFQAALRHCNIEKSYSQGRSALGAQLPGPVRQGLHEVSHLFGQARFLHVAVIRKGRTKGVGEDLRFVQQAQVQVYADLPQVVLAAAAAHAPARAQQAGRPCR